MTEEEAHVVEVRFDILNEIIDVAADEDWCERPVGALNPLRMNEGVLPALARTRSRLTLSFVLRHQRTAASDNVALPPV